MSKKNPSPVKIFANTNQYSDERELMIRKFTQQLTIARGRQKQCALLKNYLDTILEKTNLAERQKGRNIAQLKQKLQYTHKALNQYKKEVQILKKQYKTTIAELADADDQQAQRRKLLKTKTVQIDRLKKDLIVSQQDKARLIIDTFRLKSQQQNLYQQIRRFQETLKNRQTQLSQINAKMIQVKAYIKELSDDNKIFKQKLKKYQFENNDLNDNLGDKEVNIDVLQDNFQKKHDQISQQVQIIIQFEHKNDKIKKQIQHKNNLIKKQIQNTNQTNQIIRKMDKNLNEQIKQVKLVNAQCQEIDMANNDISNQNQKMKQDLIKCQHHLENLLRNNANIQEQMQTYIREDQLIINMIRNKRVLPTTDYLKDLRTSRANLKNSGRTTF